MKNNGYGKIIWEHYEKPKSKGPDKIKRVVSKRGTTTQNLTQIEEFPKRQAARKKAAERAEDKRIMSERKRKRKRSMY